VPNKHHEADRISMRKHERMRTSCLCLPQDGGLPRGCQIFKIAQNNYVTTPLPLAALCIQGFAPASRITRSKRSRDIGILERDHVPFVDLFTRPETTDAGPRQNYSIEKEQDMSVLDPGARPGQDRRRYR
jgi:hypothetical protein